MEKVPILGSTLPRNLPVLEPLLPLEPTPTDLLLPMSRLKPFLTRAYLSIIIYESSMLAALSLLPSYSIMST
jgi:hypothetical protein